MSALKSERIINLLLSIEINQTTLCILRARAFSNLFFGYRVSSNSKTDLSQRLQLTKSDFSKSIHAAVGKSGTEDLVVPNGPVSIVSTTLKAKLFSDLRSKTFLGAVNEYISP